MSRRSRQAFQNLLRIRWPMAPDPAEPRMPIRSADELIDEATRRLADLDRRLAQLQRLRPRGSLSVKLARAERDLARIDLLELIELAEMPVEFMGSA
jgi:hypothetical protein